MKLVKLHWIANFYLGIILVSCKEANFENDSGSSRLPQASVHKPGTTTREQYDSGISASIDTKYKPLPPNEFSSTLFQILTPEIFSQSNPLIYLLHKILNLEYNESNNLRSEVIHVLRKNQLPSYYVPYAKATLPILFHVSNLRRLRRAIFDIKNSADSSSFALPDTLASPLLSGVFSPDIFSDPNPPTVIFNKTIDFEENDIPQIYLKLQNIFWYRLLPNEYVTYAKELASFLNSGWEHSRLREFNFKMRNVLID